MRSASSLGTVDCVGRVARLTLPSPAIYHVTSRGVAHGEIYLDDEDRAQFVSLLRRVARRWNWRCPAYTLMSNHYHVLVDARIEDVSLGMRTLNGAYARGFNERHARVGHLFQGRFDIRVLNEEEHLANAREYIWNNPVRIGLCSTASEWPWNGSV
jgi:putative transposase